MFAAFLANGGAPAIGRSLLLTRVPGCDPPR
jgi:hypothetical protein